MTAPTPTLNRAALAAIVDHTLLRSETTPADVTALIEEARELGVYSICISPTMLPVDASPVLVTTVCGFPSGTHRPAFKAAEAFQAVADGADEIDMVIDLGAVMAGHWHRVREDIATVRAAVPAPTVLKVIIESAALTDQQIVAACRAAMGAGADFVKTSTGFHPAGGASVHAVRLMAETVGQELGVKASGGIRTAAQAVAMIAAGATRLGLSGTAAVLDGLEDDDHVSDQHGPRAHSGGY